MKKSFRFYYLGLILFGLFLAVPLLTSATSDPSLRLNSGVRRFFSETSNTAVDASQYSANFYITNNCGVDLFVGNRTSAEWLSFKNNKPSCVGITYKNCGDGLCVMLLENYSNCSADCLPICGDGVCLGETCSSCSADCEPCAPVCGDGTCNGTETCYSCPADCLSCPPICGDGTCNDSETSDSCPGDCPGCCLLTFFEFHQGEDCSAWFCIEGNGNNDYCSRNCTYIDAETRQQKSIRYYKYKNSNMQGAIDTPCRTAPDMNYCSHLPDCAWMNPLPKCNLWCGDGTCSSSIGESCSSCPADCLCSTCGDGTCNNGTETCLTCTRDCGSCPCQPLNAGDEAYCAGFRNEYSCESKSSNRCFWSYALY